MNEMTTMASKAEEETLSFPWEEKKGPRLLTAVAGRSPHLIGWPTQTDDFAGDLGQQTIVFLLAQQRDQSIDQYAKTLAGINGEHDAARQAL